MPCCRPMSNSIVIGATSSRISKGLLAIPSKFAHEWFPSQRTDITVFLGTSGKPIDLPFVPATQSTKEARIYGLTDWYAREDIAHGDAILIIALDRQHTIYHASLHDQDDSTQIYSDEIEESFVEGRSILVVHLSKERNRGAVLRKKQASMDENGRLRCEVCSFDFAECYGPLGDGFGECHHRLPLAQLKDESATRLRDLAIVCANCHRMLHRQPQITVEELRFIVHHRRG